MIEEKTDTEEGNSYSQKQAENHIEYLSLDPSNIDTSVVSAIGTDKYLNSILLWVNNNLSIATINFDDFAEKTIKPPKRNLSEVLVGHKSRQSIINSVITMILSSIENIKRICQQQKNENSNESIDGDVGRDVKQDAQLLVELASRKENTKGYSEAVSST